MTNGDKVRSMTDEQLAERFGFEECRDSRYGYICPAFQSNDVSCGGECRQNFLMWLKKEVDMDDE